MIKNTEIIVFMTVTLFIATNQLNKTEDKLENNKKTVNQIDNVEVPDSSLMILDRLNIRKLSTIKYLGRQNEDSGNSTTSRRCSCVLGVCKCCTGFLMDLINQRACMKVTYYPGDFAFDIAMSINDRVLYENSVSGKNPRPICINPPRLTNLKFCARFYNVFFPGRNFHFCLAMTGKWQSFEFFNVTFDCLRMGANGIAMLKPEEDGGLPIPTPQVGGGVDAVVDSGDEDIEEYDENVVKSLLDLFDD